MVLRTGANRLLMPGLEGMRMADAALLAPLAKFSDPEVTAKGEKRARGA
jgi:hypothetical protein